jgi:hypothetical protein
MKQLIGALLMAPFAAFVAWFVWDNRDFFGWVFLLTAVVFGFGVGLHMVTE